MELGEYVSLLEALARLGLAAGLGLVLGLDREVKNKPVGIRGYMLVALGAAGFSLLSMELVLSSTVGEQGVMIDPSRVIQGLVGGIGFLGAGAIIHREAGVRGVATGASIWVAGAIGMACGFGSYMLAIVMTVLAAAILVVMGFLRQKLGLDD